MATQATTSADLRAVIERTFAEHGEVLRSSTEQLPTAIEAAARLLVDCYRKGGKAILFGNGGSMSDALHIEGELVNRFAVDRPGVAAVALGGGQAGLTATANDYSYDDAFARLFVAHHRPGDVAIGISTSGNSENVVRALAQAKELGSPTVALTGEGGQRCAEIADVCVAVPSRSTPRVQEIHITVGHMLCDLVERSLAGSP